MEFSYLVIEVIMSKNVLIATTCLISVTTLSGCFEGTIPSQGPSYNGSGYSNQNHYAYNGASGYNNYGHKNAGGLAQLDMQRLLAGGYNDQDMQRIVAHEFQMNQALRQQEQQDHEYRMFMQNNRKMS